MAHSWAMTCIEGTKTCFFCPEIQAQRHNPAWQDLKIHPIHLDRLALLTSQTTTMIAKKADHELNPLVIWRLTLLEYTTPTLMVRVCASNSVALVLMCLLGEPCDAAGNAVPPDTPPPSRENEAPDSWTPYNNRSEFELADLLFTRTQMPASAIDELLNIWAATQIADGHEPPFKDHKEMYATIDATPLGDVPWDSFNVRYNGELPEGDIPSWMQAEHTVWFCDARTLVRNIVSRPDFHDSFDYSPLQEHDADGKHRYQNFMSGNWCWKQAVSIIFIIYCSFIHVVFRIW